MPDRFDPYAVLQVSQDASQDALLSAYRALARRFHPDLSSDPSASAQMARLNAAWETVGDPERRAAYDRTHLAGVILDTPARSASGGRPTAPWAGSAATDPARSARPAAASGSGWRVGPTVRVARVRRPATRRGRSSTSGATSAGRSARSPRVDPGYLEWLDKQPQGGRLRDEIDRTLRAKGLRIDGPSAAVGRGPRRFGLSGR